MYTHILISTDGSKLAQRGVDHGLSLAMQLGSKVTVVVESLKPIKGEVRWYSERRAGIVFDKPLDFEELAEWVGKRLEVASLKASYQRN